MVKPASETFLPFYGLKEILRIYARVIILLETTDNKQAHLSLGNQRRYFWTVFDQIGDKYRSPVVQSGIETCFSKQNKTLSEAFSCASINAVNECA